jgi:hypothetical protein
MSLRNVVSVLLVSTVLSGCATNVIESFKAPIDYDRLYLRGVFSWWEADEKYRLVHNEERRYSTTISLIADGQPYDFRFADTNWTPGMNCGYASVSDQIVEVGKSVKSNCHSIDENFRFTPTETGIFEFSIDFGTFAGFGSPKVIITKLNN